MVRIVLALLVASAALGQAQTKNSQKQPSAAQPAAKPSSTAPSNAPTLKKPEEMLAPVSPSDPVLTVHGLCPADTGASSNAAVPTTNDCVIKVTKEQFDKLINAFNGTNQPVTPAMRRQFGQAYVDILTFSEAAKAAGLENSPTFTEVLRVIRLKTLGDFYRTQLLEQSRNPSQQEIEAYYKENESKYEGAKLSRIYLPKNIPDPQATAEKKEAYQKKAAELVEEIQARAAKGEPIDKLQKEAYTTLGIGAAPPSTDLSTARHGVFPPKLDQEIFSHKAGEVFRADDANGYMIYRVESRQTIPLESVKEEIVREIGRRKMEEKIKELTAPVHTDYNEGYFGPPTPPIPAQRPTPNSSR
jgi:parvulin-like peptidyl-prolyl cis-trans isomerase-like protein